MAVLPEFTREAQKEIVKDHERAPYFDAYVAMDPGMRDRTGILYAYFDFVRGKLVIEDEALLQGPSTRTIADELLTHETRLWQGKDPYLRVSDVDLRLVADLWELHRLKFIKAEKQDSLGAINLVRNLIQSRRLEINPRCRHLIRQMENAIWDRKAKDFAQAGDNSPDGHYDLVAALKYLCRHVSWSRNPYPEGYFRVPHPANHFSSPRHNNAERPKGLLPDTPLARRLLKARKK